MYIDAWILHMLHMLQLCGLTPSMGRGISGLLYNTDFSNAGVLDFCLMICLHLYPVILFCVT